MSMLFDLAFQSGIACFMEPLSLLPIVLLVPFAMLVIFLRQPAFLKMNLARQEAEDAWVSDITDIMNTWRLLHAYKLRDERASQFEGLYSQFSRRNRRLTLFEINSKRVVKLMSEATLCAVVVLGVYAIQGGLLDAGKLLSLFQVYDRLGDDLVAFGQELIEMQRAVTALERVCEMLNERLDVDDEVRVLREKTAAAHTMESKALSAAASGKRDLWARLRNQTSLASQGNHIYLHSVAFSYSLHTRVRRASGSRSLEESSKVSLGLSAELPLGGVAGIKSDVSGLGVFTLMKLITGHLYPTTGSIDVPSHLRTLLVPPEPLVINETLWYNLTIGRIPDSDAARVWAIVEQMGLSSYLLRQPNAHVGAAGSNLRLADRQVVCIARAMLCGAQILFLYKPLGCFKLEQQTKVMEALKDWTAYEGVFAADLAHAQASEAQVELGMGQKMQLNARTVFISIDPQTRIPAACTTVISLVQDGEGGAGGTRCLFNTRGADGEWRTANLGNVAKASIFSKKRLLSLARAKSSPVHADPSLAA